MQNVIKKRAELGVAFAFLVASLVLKHFIVANPDMAIAMSRGIATPLTWPTIMLYGVALFAIGWAMQAGFALLRLNKNRKPPADEGEAVEVEAVEFGDVGFEHSSIDYPPLPVVLGIMLALVYVFAIPWLGFTVATLAFLISWFLVGGIKSPARNGLVAVLGTIVILYIFVKLALMPLDRGAGIMGDFTVALFRILGIY